MSSSSEYLVLDSGNGRKLEQVGPYLLDRPAAGALWQPRLEEGAWQKADAFFERTSEAGGKWQFRSKSLPASWNVAYQNLNFEIKLTDFGHIGLFPEHLTQAEAVTKVIRDSQEPTVLNLFAYTGALTLAAAQSGAAVTHVDASKSSVSWARSNADHCGLTDAPIRWICDDAAKYVGREVKRERTYNGIILDPPSFGRGSKGEVWKLEEDLHNLLQKLRGILRSDGPAFVLLSTHTGGVTAQVLTNLLRDIFSTKDAELTAGELFLPTGPSTFALPAGSFALWRRG